MSGFRHRVPGSASGDLSFIFRLSVLLAADEELKTAVAPVFSAAALKMNVPTTSPLIQRRSLVPSARLGLREVAF
jgi:hypothetical protein